MSSMPFDRFVRSGRPWADACQPPHTGFSGVIWLKRDRAVASGMTSLSRPALTSPLGW